LTRTSISGERLLADAEEIDDVPVGDGHPAQRLEDVGCFPGG
jgi:hypothetical protein